PVRSMEEKQKNGGRLSSRAETGDVLMLSDFTIKSFCSTSADSACVAHTLYRRLFWSHAFGVEKPYSIKNVECGITS
ncbi:MAG: hypothetical protein FWF96_04395, partial [Kiritimatiellaeota bacterium]|nr:hypothetical protein [Kiritimatiellota bacterium]